VAGWWGLIAGLGTGCEQEERRKEKEEERRKKKKEIGAVRGTAKLGRFSIEWGVENR
jgi:hypothetical protein